jgi:hypothetical protein
MNKITITMAVLLAMLLAGCGGSGAKSPHHTVAAQAPASSASPSCHDQAVAWRDSADPQMHALIRALRNFSRSSTNLGSAQAAADHLRTVSQDQLGNLPPACITGARADVATSMHDFIAAADSIDLGTTTSISNARLQIDAGSAAIQRAIKDVGRWVNGQ